MICAIDNLGKGAAGQAVQNANLALGLARDGGPAAARRARVSVTAAKGFVASGVAAGIRRRERKDLAIVRSLPHADRRARCSRATACRRRCLQVDREHLSLADPQAVVINSGVANAATGERGKLDALATAAEAARLLGLDAEEVLVLSTGVIGARLPLHKLLPGLEPRGRRALRRGRRRRGRGDHDHRHAPEGGGRRAATASPSAAWRRAPG